MKEKKLSRILGNHLTSLFSFINLGFIQASNALIQIIWIPIITRVIGIAELGLVGVATTYAMVISLLINYGSNQSGVKDVALHQHDKHKLSEIFYTIYITRILFFILSFAVLLVLYKYFHLANGFYFLLANTIIVGETLNPFFFFVGIQRLLVYNIVNMAGRLLSAAAIIFYIRSGSDSAWVNFYLGSGSILSYGFLLGYAVKKNKLAFYGISYQGFKKFLVRNFYLTGNGLSVQMQQSVFMFSLYATDNPLILGAYTLCDKIVWSSRLLIISFSNAIYPRAVVSFRERNDRWRYYKKRINMAFLAIFIIVGLGIILFAPYITLLITGKENELLTFYIKCVSFVPLVMALNSLNVIDLLMKDKYHYIFIIAVILLALTITSSTLFITNKDPWIFGYYPITVEIFSLPLYWYFIYRTRTHK